MLDALENQQELVQDTNKSTISYLYLIPTWRTQWSQQHLPSKFVVQQKAAALALLLHVAKQNMNAWVWEWCSKGVVAQLKVFGLTQVKMHKPSLNLPQFLRGMLVLNPKSKEESPTLLQSHSHCVQEQTTWKQESVFTKGTSKQGAYYKLWLDLTEYSNSSRQCSQHHIRSTQHQEACQTAQMCTWFW